MTDPIIPPLLFSIHLDPISTISVNMEDKTQWVMEVMTPFLGDRNGPIFT